MNFNLKRTLITLVFTSFLCVPAFALPFGDYIYPYPAGVLRVIQGINKDGSLSAAKLYNKQGPTNLFTIVIVDNVTAYCANLAVQADRTGRGYVLSFSHPNRTTLKITGCAIQ